MYKLIFFIFLSFEGGDWGQSPPWLYIIFYIVFEVFFVFDVFCVFFRLKDFELDSLLVEVNCNFEITTWEIIKLPFILTWDITSA